MNEHFLAFIALGKTLASDAGLAWDFETDDEGLAVDSVGWNLTKAAGDVATSNRYLRDLGPDRKAFDYLVAQDSTMGASATSRKALSQHWRDLLQSAVAEQLLFQRNTVAHVTENIARPLRILAASVDCAPWELTADDVRRAVDVARAIQPSGLLATCLASQIKALFDGQHLCDAGPLYPALGTATSFVNRRSRKARHRLSQDELREQLDDRKNSERLPSRKAFWELVRIVFTEQPKTFGDSLRFASCQILLMCGLRAGEVALIPSDWKRQRDYVDAKGHPAGEAGGISTSLMLRHFPEKQQEAESDSRVLREGVQPVPEMFRDLLMETLDRVARMACMPDESLPLTDLKELGREVLADGPSSALPCNLPDHWLRRIARDLDACSPDSEPVEEHSLYMSGPLALVLHLLLGKTGQSSAAVSFDQLERYFKEYRLEVNFELISRLTNVLVEPATLASIFEGRTVTVKLDQDWEPEEN